MNVSSVVIVALLALALALWGLWRWEAGRAGRASRRRNAVARRGEAEALVLLARAGFEVVEEQVAGAWTIVVDDEPVEVGCRADLLVKRGDLVYVADVKTGRVAPDPTHPATRRQLLEYQVAFEIDGVLLIDMVERRIREIRFPTTG